MKTIVVIPTYNESENIEDLIKEIFSLKIKGLEILVVDDNSPDKTAEIVSLLKNKKGNENGKINLIVRKGKRGRGLAGIEGFKKALELNADYIIEMDADFSHDPKYIPLLLENAKKYDFVLGSRLVLGSKDKERTCLRRTITKWSNFYVRAILGLKVKDCNCGYRCFNKKVLSAVVPKLKSKGPDVVQETLYKSIKRGFSLKEIPIKFHKRREGKSKLGFMQFIRGLLVVLKLRFSKE